MKNAILAIVSLAVLGCHAQYKTMLHARITPTNSVVVDIPDWAKSDVPPVSEDGTLDYNALTNKPSINGTTIEGSLTTEDLGITVGASDYNDLTNRPSINGVELSGDKSAADLGLATSDEALLAIYYPEGNVTSLDQITTNGLTYTFNDATRTATLSNGINAKGDVVIPWKVTKDGKEYKVTAIGEYAFFDKYAFISANITSIVAPTSVMSVGGYAFMFCQALTSVSLPTVTSAGEYAFGSCFALTTVSLPSAITIGEAVFGNCSALTTVSLPSATSIGISAFVSCFELTTVSIPSVTTIGDSAFEGCSALTTVSLPSVMTIGEFVFSDCSALTTVSLPSATSIGNSAFVNCFELTTVSIPSVTTIGDSAFAFCSALTTVNFGATPRNSVPTLGGYSFYEVLGSCKFIIPLGMYDEWIAADRWNDLYGEGYKFVGYADAGEVMNGAAVSNIVETATADHVKSNDMASAIAPINNNVNVMWTYVFGERVWFAVTNYMRTAGGVAPSLQLFEVRDGQTNLVYWSAEEIDIRVGDKIDIAMSNIVDTVVTAKADRAWSKYQSMTGADNPQPNDVTIVSTPSVMLSGGYEWQRFVDTGAEVWVLKCNDLITLGADTNAYFRITDLEGETQFAIEKTASKLVDAVPTATGFTTDGNNYFKVTFSGNIQPTIYVSLDLINSPFVECSATENDYGLTCSWEHDSAANTYTATIAYNAGDGKPSKMFVYGKVLQEGSTVVKHTAPSSFDGGIIINGIQYSVGTATIDGNTVMTLNPVTRAVSE